MHLQVLLSLVLVALTPAEAAPAKCGCKDIVITPSEQSCLLGHLLEIITHLVHNQQQPIKCPIEPPITIEPEPEIPTVTIEPEPEPEIPVTIEPQPEPLHVSEEELLEVVPPTPSEEEVEETEEVPLDSESLEEDESVAPSSEEPTSSPESSPESEELPPPSPEPEGTIAVGPELFPPTPEEEEEKPEEGPEGSPAPSLIPVGLEQYKPETLFIPVIKFDGSPCLNADELREYIFNMVNKCPKHQ